MSEQAIFDDLNKRLRLTGGTRAIMLFNYWYYAIYRGQSTLATICINSAVVLYLLLGWVEYSRYDLWLLAPIAIPNYLEL